MGDSTPSESNASTNSATTLGSTGALESLLRENLELSKKIFHQNKKIQRRMTFMAVSDGLRILLIVVPLIIALIYLPPLLKPALQQYQDLLQTSSTISQHQDSINQLLKLLK